MSDEIDRYLEVNQAAKQVGTVVAIAMQKAAGDADKAIAFLEQMRGFEDLPELAFSGDVVTVAQQAIREAEAIDG